MIATRDEMNSTASIMTPGNVAKSTRCLDGQCNVGLWNYLVFASSETLLLNEEKIYSH